MERFRPALEQLPIIAFTRAWDPTGTPLYVSPQVQELLGLDPQALCTDTELWFRHVHPDDVAWVRAEMNAAYEAQRPFRAEYRMLHHDGHELWVRDEESIVHDADGHPQQVEGVVVEITPAKRTEGALRSLSAEQQALRTVATVVAAGAPAGAVFGLVAEQVARLFAADSGGVVRDVSRDRIEIAGHFAAGRTSLPAGEVVEMSAGPEFQTMRRTGRPVFADVVREGAESFVARLGYRSCVLAPVRVASRTWGALVVASLRAGAFDEAAAQRLLDFADLVAMAVTNAEARARLDERASTDMLTGLLNHRAFHERVRAEASRALRHRRRLSVALLDIDHFKTINDTLGHQAGDEVLVAVAQRLSEIVRDEDVLARVGGDEFALLLPETRRVQAFATVERARAAVATELLPRDVHLTMSAGICDLDTAGDADRLVRLADGALYWSKAHGRNVSWIYDPAVVRELSADERAAQLERSNAMLGIRALARAIDAKDPSTHEHSERVAALVEAMARARGWAPERVALLRDAALVHDVGKIGVRDAILLKPGALTREEHEEVKRHATLGADIVADVLFPEQVVWVRSHHERPDGAGYPDGLADPDIPEGARLLAVADAYDVMTVARPYSDPKQPTTALAECRQLAGRQFDPEAVEALCAVVESGAGSLTSADTQESAAVPGPERGGSR